MFGIFSVGVALWLGYGLILDALPVVLANAVTLVLAVTILVLKWRYGRDLPPRYGAAQETDDGSRAR
jgi:MtN3 and saliva related transmembrane protein